MKKIDTVFVSSKITHLNQIKWNICPSFIKILSKTTMLWEILIQAYLN